MNYEKILNEFKHLKKQGEKAKKQIHEISKTEDELIKNVNKIFDHLKSLKKNLN